MKSLALSPCSRCGGPRRVERLREIQVEGCLSCGAVTLGRADLMRLVDDRQALPPRPLVHGQTLLPDDEMAMDLPVIGGHVEAVVSAPAPIEAVAPVPKPLDEIVGQTGESLDDSFFDDSLDLGAEGSPLFPVGNETLMPVEFEPDPTTESAPMVPEYTEESILGALPTVVSDGQDEDIFSRFETAEHPTVLQGFSDEEEPGFLGNLSAVGQIDEEDDFLESYQTEKRTKTLLLLALGGGLGLLLVTAMVAGFFWTAESSTRAPSQPLLVDEAPVEMSDKQPLDPKVVDSVEENVKVTLPEEKKPVKPKSVTPKPVKKSTSVVKPRARKKPSGAALVDKGWRAVGGEPKKAAALFEQALALNSGNSDAQYGLGYALLQMNEVSRALPYLCKAKSRGSVETVREVTGLLGRKGLSCD